VFVESREHRIFSFDLMSRLREELACWFLAQNPADTTDTLVEERLGNIPSSGLLCIRQEVGRVGLRFKSVGVGRSVWNLYTCPN